MTALPINQGQGQLPEPIRKLLGGAKQVGGTLDSFLGKPGGSLLMNLLAQSGYSTMPDSPFGAIGRASLATQRMDLQRRLFESKIGLQDAQAGAAGVTGDADKPLTDIGKLIQDRRNDFVTDEQLNAQLASIDDKTFGSSQERTDKMRNQFRTDIGGVSQSLSDLAKSKALISRGGPIADTAAFTSFIRSIDNSVVRPAEQAAYSQAGGLSRAFSDQISKLQGKGPLGADTRRDLLGSINAIEAELRGIHDRTVNFYNGMSEQFGLRPENVTGIPIANRRDVTIPPDDTGTDLSTEDQLADVNRQLEEVNAELAELEKKNASR